MRRSFQPYDDVEKAAIVAQAKIGLRARMRALRGAIPKAARRARSQAIAERIFALDVFASARTIAAFMPIHAEVDLADVRAEAARRGIEIVLPRVDPASGQLVLCHAREEDLVTGTYGIAEPSEHAKEADLMQVDLIFVPALVVDPCGHRVGYGKGYYDRLLVRLPQAAACVVAYDFQLIAEVPHDAHDMPVDWVVTDRRMIETGARKRSMHPADPQTP